MDTMLLNRGYPRFHFVPVPKAAAWLNLIEGFWNTLIERPLAGRDFRDTVQLAASLKAGVADWNEYPTPFPWGQEPRPKRHIKRTYVYRI